LHRFTRYSQIADIFIKYGFGRVLEGFIPDFPGSQDLAEKGRGGIGSICPIRMMIEELADVYQGSARS